MSLVHSGLPTLPNCIEGYITPSTPYSSNFTLMTWANINTYVNRCPILRIHNNGATSATLASLALMVNGSNFSLYKASGSDGSANPGYFSTTTPVVLNTWYHCVIRKTGLDIEIIVNGVSIRKVVTTLNPTYPLGNCNLWGVRTGNSSATVSSSEYIGNCAHFRLFNTSLSLPQIVQEKNSCTPVLTGNVVFSYGLKNRQGEQGALYCDIYGSSKAAVLVENSTPYSVSANNPLSGCWPVSATAVFATAAVSGEANLNGSVDAIRTVSILTTTQPSLDGANRAVSGQLTAESSVDGSVDAIRAVSALLTAESSVDGSSDDLIRQRYLGESDGSFVADAQVDGYVDTAFASAGGAETLTNENAPAFDCAGGG